MSVKKGSWWLERDIHLFQVVQIYPNYSEVLVQGPPNIGTFKVTEQALLSICEEISEEDLPFYLMRQLDDDN